MHNACVSSNVALMLLSHSMLWSSDMFALCSVRYASSLISNAYLQHISSCNNFLQVTSYRIDLCCLIGHILSNFLLFSLRVYPPRILHKLCVSGLTVSRSRCIYVRKTFFFFLAETDGWVVQQMIDMVLYCTVFILHGVSCAERY